MRTTHPGTSLPCPTRSRGARLATPFAAVALLAAPLALAPTAQAAPGDPAVSAAYLAERLAATGDRLQAGSGDQTYDDLGLTIDAVLAIEATGTADAQAGASADYVLGAAGQYTGADTGDLYVGATGKLLTLTASRGLPTTVGGTDYLAALQGLEQDSGQFADQSAYGDYSNTLSQSFALIGLKRNGVNPSTESVAVLLDQQCADGGFSLTYGDGCASDPDATSVAVQALTAVGGQDAVVTEAAEYLAGRQGADGGVGGGTATEGANANSTGLATVAFRLAGRDADLAEAREFLRALTFDCSFTELAGGIAYDRAAFDAAAATGPQTPADDQTTRATAQALLGLTDVSYVNVSAGDSQDAADATCAEPTEEPAPTTTTAPTTTEDPTPTPTTGGDAAATPTTTSPEDSAGTEPTATAAPSADPVVPSLVATDSPQRTLPGLAVLGLGALGLLTAGALVLARPRGARR